MSRAIAHSHVGAVVLYNVTYIHNSVIAAPIAYHVSEIVAIELGDADGGKDDADDAVDRVDQKGALLGMGRQYGDKQNEL